MKKLFALIVLAVSLPASAQLAPVNGFCEQGAQAAVTSGINSTNKLQGIVPGCTVTPYLTGTTTLATYYLSLTGNPQTGPFTADTTTGQYLFYATSGVGLDVARSSGTTQTGVVPGGGSGGVFQIIAGTNVTISPPGGTGAVTINSNGGGSGTVSSATVGQPAVYTGTTTVGGVTSLGIGVGGTGATTAGGALTNLGAAAANASTTVNGQACTLGSTCTVTATPSSAINLASSGSGGVTGTLPVGNGGTGSPTAVGAMTNLMNGAGIALPPCPGIVNDSATDNTAALFASASLNYACSLPTNVQGSNGTIEFSYPFFQTGSTNVLVGGGTSGNANVAGSTNLVYTGNDPGFTPTAGTWPALNISAGTQYFSPSFCTSGVAVYGGGSVNLTANATNYVYLDPSVSCTIPQVNTTGFPSANLTHYIAKVLTGASSITTITQMDGGVITANCASTSPYGDNECRSDGLAYLNFYSSHSHNTPNIGYLTTGSGTYLSYGTYMHHVNFLGGFVQPIQLLRSGKVDFEFVDLVADTYTCATPLMYIGSIGNESNKMWFMKFRGSATKSSTNCPTTYNVIGKSQNSMLITGAGPNNVIIDDSSEINLPNIQGGQTIITVQDVEQMNGPMEISNAASVEIHYGMSQTAPANLAYGPLIHMNGNNHVSLYLPDTVAGNPIPSVVVPVLGALTQAGTGGSSPYFAANTAYDVVIQGVQGVSGMPFYGVTKFSNIQTVTTSSSGTDTITVPTPTSPGTGWTGFQVCVGLHGGTLYAYSTIYNPYGVGTTVVMKKPATGAACSNTSTFYNPVVALSQHDTLTMLSPPPDYSRLAAMTQANGGTAALISTSDNEYVSPYTTLSIPSGQIPVPNAYMRGMHFYTSTNTSAATVDVDNEIYQSGPGVFSVASSPLALNKFTIPFSLDVASGNNSLPITITTNTFNSLNCVLVLEGDSNNSEMSTWMLSADTGYNVVSMVRTGGVGYEGTPPNIYLTAATNSGKAITFSATNSFPETITGTVSGNCYNSVSPQFTSVVAGSYAHSTAASAPDMNISTESLILPNILSAPAIATDSSGNVIAASLSLASLSDGPKALKNCGTMTTTAAASNTLSCSWVTASSNCSVTPSNSTAVAWTYFVPTTGVVTVYHAATAGATYAIACSGN